jgi:hypothetical protein
MDSDFHLPSVYHNKCEDLCDGIEEDIYIRICPKCQDS